MIIYFIKTVAASGILFGIYYLLLERQSTYIFNRFYLLGSIALSFVIPFVTIHTHVQVLQVMRENPVYNSASIRTLATYKPETASGHDWLFIGTVTAYAVVTFLLLCRYVYNIVILIERVNNHSAVYYKQARLVLVRQPITPYSFFNNVFIHVDDYNSQQLEPELLTHELIHAKQKHTWDVLFIELLQAFFWINPCIILYKKAITLNHEYIADKQVISTHGNIYNYQTLLLEKIAKNTQAQFASSFNYYLTKKRLTMMKKTTTPVTALFVKMATMPLLIGTVILFSAQTYAQVNTGNANPATQANIAASQTGATQSMLDEYENAIKNALSTFKSRNGVTSTMVDFRKISAPRLDFIYRSMTAEQKAKATKIMGIPIPPPPAKESPTVQELQKWQNATLYGVWVDGKRIKNSELVNYKPVDFASYFVSRLAKNAVKNDGFYVQIDLYTPAYYDIAFKENIDANKQHK